jgi:type VI secretion system protein VasD
VLVAVVVCCLPGCATTGEPQRDARIAVAASPSINPDATGRPSPVVVRIYELAAGNSFERATFFELFDRDRDVLGNDVIARSVITVRPGQRVLLNHPLDKRTHDIALMVAYRDFDHARWRAIANVSDGDLHMLTVNIARLSVALRDDKAMDRQADWGPVEKIVMPVWKALATTVKSLKQQSTN